MARRNKKRTKRYAGEDAKHLQQPAPQSNEPVVHRYTAVQRGALGQWWHDKKRTVKITAIAVAIVGIGGWLLVELFNIVF